MLNERLVEVHICCRNRLALHLDVVHDKLRDLLVDFLLYLIFDLLLFNFYLFFFDLYIIFFLLDFLDIFD
jgi:hypothetical protein